jgi:cytochrome c-type biogenesis protein
MSSFANTVSDGPLLVAAAAAALVGVLGFLSPCVLPLVPGYLSYVTGLTGTDTTSGTAPRQRRTLAGAALFVAGFSAVFIASGAVLGVVGQTIATDRLLLERIAGGVTILMGLVFLGRIRPLQRNVRFRGLPRAGLAGAPLVGAAFGLAWTPCLTPTVGAVYALSISQDTAGRGAFLAAAYCLGLGVPFLLVAAGFGWLSHALGYIRRHHRAIGAIGGAVLVGMGVLLLSGVWDHWMNVLRATFGPNTGVGAGL